MSRLKETPKEKPPELDDSPATRTVKVSDKYARKLKVAAAVLRCTQQEVVEKAMDLLWPDVKLLLNRLSEVPLEDNNGKTNDS